MNRRIMLLLAATILASGLQPGIEHARQVFGDVVGTYSLGQFGYLLVWDHNITPFLGTP